MTQKQKIKELKVRISNFEEMHERLKDIPNNDMVICVIKENIENLKKQLKRVEDFKYNKNSLYINISDFQGGDFAIGYYGTLKQWRAKAMEWCYLDEHSGLYRDLKTYKIKNYQLIDFINTYWEIEIVEYDKNKNYDISEEDLCRLDY